MTVPYNLFPFEAMVPMVTAEAGKVTALNEAATMWADVRKWIDLAKTELQKRLGELTPEWTDENGRTLEEQTQRTLTELTAWGERIDASKVSQSLTTLATSISEASLTVTGLYEQYKAALLIPFGLGVPLAFSLQQAAGTRMSALGGQFDVSMLTVCAATGVKSPTDLVSGLQMPTAAEAKAMADAATDTLSAVQGIAESLGGGTGSGTVPEVPTTDWPTPDWSTPNGPSLAGLSPSGLDPRFAGLSGGGVSTGGLPVGGSQLPLGGAGAPGVAPLPAGGVPSGGIGGVGGMGMAPPMMPMHGGRGAGGLRPGLAEHPLGRTGTRRTPATGKDGVLSVLQGRSGAGEPTEFTLNRSRDGEVLDEELWQT